MWSVIAGIVHPANLIRSTVRIARAQGIIAVRLDNKATWFVRRVEKTFAKQLGAPEERVSDSTVVSN